MPTGSVSIYILMQPMGVPILNIARSWDCFMFMIGIVLVVRRNLHIKMPGISRHVRCLPCTPWLSLCNPAQCNPIQFNPNQSNVFSNKSNVKPVSNQFNLKSKLIANQNKSNSILNFKYSLLVWLLNQFTPLMCLLYLSFLVILFGMCRRSLDTVKYVKCKYN